MASKLHELLAVEKDLTAIAGKMEGEAKVTFQKKPDHFRGHVKATKYLAEARSGENLVDTKNVVETVSARLQYALSHVGKYFDMMLSKDATNQLAKADLLVDDVVLAKDVPATFLLAMESKLATLRDLFLNIPTLDPALDWTEGGVNDTKDVFKSNVLKSFKTEATIGRVVLYEATKEHPAQIEKYTQQVSVASIETVQYSSMWSVQQKADTIDRLDKLIQACKRARQRANAQEVNDRKVANQMFNYVLGNMS